MRGMLRPCRHQLEPEVFDQWRAHLCGGCLALRDLVGQAARVVTSRDATLVSVLVDAQIGRAATRVAGPCPLRGGRRATVIASDTVAARTSAAVGLLGAAAALRDKALDGDLPALARPAATFSARRLAAHGERIADGLGLDAAPILGAPAEAARAERVGRTLADFLAPTGAAVAEVFAATAILAGHPENAAALAAAGDAYGRLDHLVDAITDLDEDRAKGAFNPLEASGTARPEALALARALADDVRTAARAVRWHDDRLVTALFGPTLDRAINRAFGTGRGAVATSVAIGIAAVAALASMGDPPPPGDGEPPAYPPAPPPPTSIGEGAAPDQPPAYPPAPPPPAGANQPLPPPPLATGEGGQDATVMRSKRGCRPTRGDCFECGDCCECIDCCDC